MLKCALRYKLLLWHARRQVSHETSSSPSCREIPSSTPLLYPRAIVFATSFRANYSHDGKTGLHKARTWSYFIAASDTGRVNSARSRSGPISPCGAEGMPLICQCELAERDCESPSHLPDTGGFGCCRNTASRRVSAPAFPELSYACEACTQSLIAAGQLSSWEEVCDEAVPGGGGSRFLSLWLAVGSWRSMSRRKLVVCLGVVALITSGVMLPWTENAVHYQYTARIERERIPTRSSAGYHSIFNPPQQVIWYDDSGAIKYAADYAVDHERLVLEWAFIVLVTLALVFVVKPGGTKGAA